jgi:NAD(P)H-hydrate repair Nnr-like enzyme with NAD(P)H-hydrate epimerase domain
MLYYFTANQIRAAEAPLLAGLPEGALMRRAATGLASAITAELRRRTGGVAGRTVCAVVGSGDNGGDALWAAAFLPRCVRGSGPAQPRAHPRRGPGGIPGGGRAGRG